MTSLRMLRSGKYHDFTVKCNDRTWKVHRAVICAKSKYFESLCDGQFKVLTRHPPTSCISDYRTDDTSKEAQERSVSLEDDDPKYVEAMLLYMYTAEYPFIGWKDSVPDQLLVDAKLYTLADKYIIPTLKNLISGHFTNYLLAITERDHSPPMKALPELLATVYEGTPNTDRGLRDKLLTHMLQHKKKFLGRKSVRMYAGKNHDFALDLLNHYMAEAHSYAADKFLYWCRTCKKYTSRSFGGSCGFGHDLLDWTGSPEILIS